MKCLMLVFEHNVSQGLSRWEEVPACVCLCVCLCVSVHMSMHMCCLFPPLWRLQSFFFLFKPCCFATPWAFKPLGGRYGLVFEFPAARREAHKQLAHIQFTVSPAHAAHTHGNTDLVSESTEHVWGCFIFLILFLSRGQKKHLRREKGGWRKGGGERRGRGGDEVWENEGGRGREDREGWNIIMCHRIWSGAKTHAVNNLWWVFAEPVVVALKI